LELCEKEIKKTANKHRMQIIHPSACNLFLPSSPPPSPKIPELSTGIKFLNSLSTTQVDQLIAKILLKHRYPKLINPKNVDKEIIPAEIGSFTTVTPEDGK
jgi:hypothetical protein